jgi:hypothetical protein
MDRIEHKAGKGFKGCVRVASGCGLCMFMPMMNVRPMGVRMMKRILCLCYLNDSEGWGQVGKYALLQI